MRLKTGRHYSSVVTRTASSSCAECKVDRLVLKAMPGKSPKAQTSDGKAAFFWQRVEDNAFHPSAEAAVSPAKDNLSVTNCFAAMLDKTAAHCVRRMRGIFTADL